MACECLSSTPPLSIPSCTVVRENGQTLKWVKKITGCSNQSSGCRNAVIFCRETEPICATHTHTHIYILLDKLYMIQIIQITRKLYKYNKELDSAIMDTEKSQGLQSAGQLETQEELIFS